MSSEKKDYLQYSDDASYDFMPTKKSMKIVKNVKYVTSLVSHKKHLTPVRSHFYLVFHSITSCP